MYEEGCFNRASWCFLIFCAFGRNRTMNTCRLLCFIIHYRMGSWFGVEGVVEMVAPSSAPVKFLKARGEGWGCLHKRFWTPCLCRVAHMSRLLSATVLLDSTLRGLWCLCRFIETQHSVARPDFVEAVLVDTSFLVVFHRLNVLRFWHHTFWPHILLYNELSSSHHPCWQRQ